MPGREIQSLSKTIYIHIEKPRNKADYFAHSIDLKEMLTQLISGLAFIGRKPIS